MAEYLHLFKNLSYKDIIIESDLKFLVKRFAEFYKNGETTITFPTKKPTKLSDKNFVFLKDKMPSVLQQEAIKTIFNSPISYIWGAPGTGKTQNVLAYSIVKYILNSKQVIICAPTNNALEQVLRGVLNITSQYGISPEKIKRIGVPSASFRKDYFECCEDAAKNKQLNELDILITNLKTECEKTRKILNDYKPTQKVIKESSIILKQLKSINETKRKIFDDTNELDSITKAVEDKESICSAFSINLKTSEKNQVDLAKVVNSKNFLISRTKRDNANLELKKAYNKSKSIENDISSIKKDITKLTKSINSLSNDINTNKAILNEQVHNIISKEYHKNINLILKNSTTENISEKASQIEELLNNCNNWIKTDELKSINFYEKRKDELKTKIEKSKAEYEKILEEQKHVISTADVIGCTLDKAISLPDYVKPCHIFLDEAAYANIAKTMCLFTKKVPVTFLGDHMQLPPVCEAQDEELKKEKMKYAFLWDQSAINISDFLSNNIQQIETSYFECLPPNFENISKSDLTESYRFDENLAKILDKFVYKNNFKSSGNVSNTEIIVYDASSDHSAKHNKRENLAEVSKIKEIINTFKNDDYVILSPYTNQIKQLNEALPEVAQKNLIMTVHKSQGREWDTVILSVVDKTNPYFTNSQNFNGLRVLNTAISRARKKLVIVCDVDVWKKNNKQLITALIDNISRQS
ncbi:MAG: AAA domain-containing protein [Clostridia bacterium]